MSAKIVKKHDTAATPHQRTSTPELADHRQSDLTRAYLDINPAALQRHIQALVNELLTLTITKLTQAQSPTQKPQQTMHNQLTHPITTIPPIYIHTYMWCASATDHDVCCENEVTCDIT